MAKRRSISDDAIRELREFGLTLPGTHLKSPWPGHKDLAVNDKTFAYLPPEGEPFSIGCKLPQSNGVALMLPFCEPAGYGLGRSGWVSAKPTAEQIDVAMFKQWIVESYCAQAPKKLVKSYQASGGEEPTQTVRKPAGRPAASRRPAAKRSQTARRRPRAAARRRR